MTGKHSMDEAAMKITVHHATYDDVMRIPGLVATYKASGYADGSRPKHRDCAIYTAPGSVAHVWGGPAHIRIYFASRTEGAAP
jgi:hypothetical protein